MEIAVILLFVSFAANVAFLIYLPTRSGRRLGRRSLLFWATSLPIASALVAIPNFETQGAFVFLAPPFAVAYALLGLVLGSYVRKGAPTRHFMVLALPLVGTTVLFVFIWALTGFVLPGV